MKTKALAVFLTLVMIVGLMPAIVFAEVPGEGVECTGECTNEEHVAAIGNVHYDSIQAAVDDADADSIITVIKNHHVECLGTWLTIEDDKDVTIDLNGKVINVTSSETGNIYFIMVYGKLKLTDSSTTQTGKIDAKAELGKPDLNLLRAQSDSKVVIESGTYCLDRSTNGCGMIDSRGDEIITVNGGTFVLKNFGSASNESPWVFNASSQNTQNIIVNGGSFNDDIIHQYYPFEVMAPKEKALKKEYNDTFGCDMWTMVDAVAYVAENEKSGQWYSNEVGYETLTEAIASAHRTKDSTGEQEIIAPMPITLLEDCHIDNIQITKDVPINLNGKRILWDGAVNNPVITVKEEGKLTIGKPEIEKEGYRFDGWYTDAEFTNSFPFNEVGTTIIERTTLYAKWIPKIYTITYSLNDGTVDGTNPPEYTIESEDITLIEPNKIGHTFGGWTGTDLNSPTETVTIPKGSFGNRTYTANWTANQYDVTFFTDSGTINSNMIDNYTYGVGATLPTDVIKSGYRFGGWYDNVECTGDPVTAIGITEVGNKGFYAKWTPVAKKDPTYTPVIDNGIGGDITVSDKSPEQGDQVTITANPDKGYEVNEIIVTDSKGNPVEVIKNDDGTYSYIQPAGKVTITANYVCDGGEGCLCKGYTDLDPDQWYHEAVDYVVENGIMNGVGEDEFDPNGELTRAMMWTMLARLDGVDTTGDSVWYASALEWAKDKGITDGTGANKDITREQMVTMLYRYAQYKGHDVSVGEDTNILSFEDALEISEWAMPAMQWACGAGVIEGDGSKLDPKVNTTRCEAAAMLMRFCEL